MKSPASPRSWVRAANYDFLTFSIDGNQVAQWSGTQSGNFSTPVSLGQHTLKWSYVKDGSVSSGSDAAWTDDVTIPLANYTQEMQALVQSVIALTSGTGSTETFLTVLNPYSCLLYTSPSPRDQRGSRMPSSA